MGVESRNLLSVLSKLGIVKKDEYKKSCKYVLDCPDSYFRPDMADLKTLEALCTPDKMWIDTGSSKIHLEYDQV